MSLELEKAPGRDYHVTHMIVKIMTGCPVKQGQISQHITTATRHNALARQLPCPPVGGHKPCGWCVWCHHVKCLICQLRQSRSFLNVARVEVSVTAQGLTILIHLLRNLNWHGTSWAQAWNSMDSCGSPCAVPSHPVRSGRAMCRDGTRDGFVVSFAPAPCVHVSPASSSSSCGAPFGGNPQNGSHIVAGHVAGSRTTQDLGEVSATNCANQASSSSSRSTVLVWSSDDLLVMLHRD